MVLGMANKDQIITFNVPKPVKKKLQRLKNYTVHIRNVVMQDQGYCPLCHQKVSKTAHKQTA